MQACESMLEKKIFYRQIETVTNVWFTLLCPGPKTSSLLMSEQKS